MIVFTVKKCRITISFWFAVMCATLLLINRDSQFTLIILFLHEMGHLGVMCAEKNYPKRIIFHLFGIDIEEGGKESYQKDALVSLGGPLCNLICGALFLFIHSRFALLNLILGGFHLLPVFYLDGGRAVYSFLSRKKEKAAADKIMFWLSFLSLFPVGVAAFYVLLQSKGNFSLLVLWVYLMGMLLLKKRQFY